MVPTVVTYGILIDCCREGDVEKARKVFDEMLERGLSPNVYIYTTLIRGFCSEARMLEAESVFAEMSKTAIDPDCPEAPLVEVYQRSYDICMQLYQKELLTETSYLNIYGLHTADFSGQQLAIAAGLSEWRDTIARTEDESTGYILPNKSLIEIAKQMPVTPANLRHVLKARHQYIERNLGAVVSIIRHSMQNALAFEPVAKKLKEEHIEMVLSRNEDG